MVQPKIQFAHPKVQSNVSGHVFTKFQYIHTILFCSFKTINQNTLNFSAKHTSLLSLLSIHSRFELLKLKFSAKQFYNDPKGKTGQTDQFLVQICPRQDLYPHNSLLCSFHISLSLSNSAPQSSRPSCSSFKFAFFFIFYFSDASIQCLFGKL